MQGKAYPLQVVDVRTVWASVGKIVRVGSRVVLERTTAGLSREDRRRKQEDRDIYQEEKDREEHGFFFVEQSIRHEAGWCRFSAFAVEGGYALSWQKSLLQFHQFQALLSAAEKFYD